LTHLNYIPIEWRWSPLGTEALDHYNTLDTSKLYTDSPLGTEALNHYNTLETEILYHYNTLDTSKLYTDRMEMVCPWNRSTRPLQYP
jgi:hypothetical protein